MSVIGHNSSEEQLRLLIERVERLEEEKKGVSEDIRDVYSEAKAVGFDPKIMRQIVRLRKMEADDRAEMEAIVEPYKQARGMDLLSLSKPGALVGYPPLDQRTSILASRAWCGCSCVADTRARGSPEWRTYQHD